MAAGEKLICDEESRLIGRWVLDCYLLLAYNKFKTVGTIPRSIKGYLHHSCVDQVETGDDQRSKHLIAVLLTSLDLSQTIDNEYWRIHNEKNLSLLEVCIEIVDHLRQMDGLNTLPCTELVINLKRLAVSVCILNKKDIIAKEVFFRQFCVAKNSSSTLAEGKVEYELRRIMRSTLPILDPYLKVVTADTVRTMVTRWLEPWFNGNRTPYLFKAARNTILNMGTSPITENRDDEVSSSLTRSRRSSAIHKQTTPAKDDDDTQQEEEDRIEQLQFAENVNLVPRSPDRNSRVTRKRRSERQVPGSVAVVERAVCTPHPGIQPTSPEQTCLSPPRAVDAAEQKGKAAETEIVAVDTPRRKGLRKLFTNSPRQLELEDAVEETPKKKQPDTGANSGRNASEDGPLSPETAINRSVVRDDEPQPSCSGLRYPIIVNKPRMILKPRKRNAPVSFDSSDDDIDVMMKIPDKSLARAPPNKRRKWTWEESRNLLLGVLKYGDGNWATILTRFTFTSRNNVHLKDRWRIMRKKSDITELKFEYSVN